ncbi:uncharacterized protein B0T15DRAFT_490101 [Chaetomium strumarium]|uniref:RRM domain-containing protein n=1 Tax=Chaetomium strumarium TaxID=1170767 RepID=A0AAJ0M735_9PEZI|nr:hypothetical protein B0T15DRAFT_490101 [Chaetomium strumarium]
MANNNGNWAAEHSPTLRNDQMAVYSRNAFSNFTDFDDQEDTGGGGVMLRDFDDGSGSGHFAPTPTNSAASSGQSHSQESRSRNSMSSTAFSKPSTSGRRNTIAPIGTGRYAEYAQKTHASVDDHLSTKTTTTGNEGRGQNAGSDHIGTTNTHFTQTAGQTQAGVTSNPYTQMSPTPQRVRFGHHTQGLDAQVNLTPNIHGGAVQYTPSATERGHPWANNATMEYNSAGLVYNTPTSGFGIAQGTALGTNLPYMNPDMTPSHVPKKSSQYLATPGSSIVYNQYNQTEPRNFAPRTGSDTVYVQPPPVFNLGRGTTAKRHENTYSTAESDADPFMSPTANRRAKVPTFSQTLVLPSVPEENHQLLLMQQPAFYVPAPGAILVPRSEQLTKLTEGPTGLPSQEVGLSDKNFPFIESGTQAAPVGYGVIKIRNIPFNTKRAEIIAFLGRNSRILNDKEEPVHIIMERVSSKTQECYVEFMAVSDAVKAVERFRENTQKGRPNRLGDRPVEVLLSSQAALMHDLFPLASGVAWEGAKPIIHAPVKGEPWKTFKGFVTDEEMIMVVKHVEIPSRSPYSKDCPQRPYECMISTIKKLPWYMTDHITLRQRHSIYEATVKLIVFLKQALLRGNRMQEAMINEQLLKRLVLAAMLCPGFSVVQKDNIAALAEWDHDRVRMFNQPRFAEGWVHLHALCPKPGTPDDVLEWYIAAIRNETTRYIHTKSDTELAEIQRTGYHTSLYFGYIWYELGLSAGDALGSLTLRQVARHELQVLKQTLRRVFPPAGPKDASN